MIRASKTTVAGTSAALCYGVSQIPGLPEWLIGPMKVGAAISMLALGYHAKDCPPNCPGTNEQGHPRPVPPPTRSPLPMLAACIAAVIALVGCIAKNPAAGPANPTAPAYVVDPRLDQTSNAIARIATTAGELTNTGPLIPTAADGILAAIAALSLLYAKHKSDVTSTLAAGVVDTGPQAVTNVLAYASDTKKYAAVAHAINEHTAAGTAPGQAAPSTSTR